MNIPNPREVMYRHQFAHKRSLGQNFLLDDALLDALVEAAGVTGSDDVLEIGAGCGTLTAALARRARSVLSIEIDRALLPVLAETLAPYPNAECIQGDVLHMDLNALAAQRFPGRCKVVANLPYYITTDVLMRLLFSTLPMDTLAVMVQREVADKMLRAPSEPGYGPLSVFCGYFAEGKRVMEIPAARFVPPPQVDSAFVRLDMRAGPPVCCADEAFLFRVVRSAFLMRRKTMLNNLQAAFSVDRDTAQACLRAAGLPEKVRGEALGLAEFARLADACLQELHLKK